MPSLRGLTRSLSTFRREAAITVGFNFTYLLISAVQGPLLARSLGPAERGDLAAVYVPFMTFSWLVVLGLPAAAAFYVRNTPEREIMAVAVRAMAFFAMPVALLLGLFAPAFLDDRPTTTVVGLRVLLFISTILVPVDVAEAMLRAGEGAGFRFNGLKATRPVLCMALLVGLAVGDRLTLTSAIGAFAVGTLVGALIELLVLRPPFTMRTNRVATRRQLSYGARSLGEGAAHTVVARVDQLILAGAGFRTELGLYAVAASLAQLSAPLSQGVSLALLPAMQRADGERAARRLASRAAVAVGVGSIALALVLVLISPFVLRLGFGEEFEDAAVLVFLLLPGEVAYDVGNVLGVEFGVRGRPGIATQGMVLAAGVTIAVLPFAIGRWGAEGAAVVTSTAYGLRLVYLLARWGAPAGTETAYGGEPGVFDDPVVS